MFRRWLAWLGIALSIGVPLLIAASTGYRYAAGSARLMWPSGHPRYRELYNLDPRYRAFVQPGWSQQLWERWAAKLEQHALVWLIEGLGPMPGSYLGPYPPRDEVRSLLLEASPALTPGELAGSFVVGDRTLQVPAAALTRALADADRGELASGGPRLDLVLLEQSCLVLAYWSQRAYHAELIDLSGFGWFAHYVYFEGQDEPLPARR
jgi:hypothetical protein